MFEAFSSSSRIASLHLILVKIKLITYNVYNINYNDGTSRDIFNINATYTLLLQQKNNVKKCKSKGNCNFISYDMINKIKLITNEDIILFEKYNQNSVSRAICFEGINLMGYTMYY